MTRSPPSLSGSTISLRMLMSEYGQPKALGDRVRQTFNKRETQTPRNYNQANTNHQQQKQRSKTSQQAQALQKYDSSVFSHRQVHSILNKLEA